MKGKKSKKSTGVLLAVLIGFGVITPGVGHASGQVGETSIDEKEVRYDYSVKHVFTKEDVEKALVGYKGGRTKGEVLKYSLRTGDWNPYYALDALKRPAFYNIEDGKFKRNKYYYGGLIESHIKYSNELLTKGKTGVDVENEGQRAERLKGLVEKYKAAPGVIPYVVGFNTSKEYADMYGVKQVPVEFFASNWNQQGVLERGIFGQEWSEVGKEVSGGEPVGETGGNDTGENDEYVYVEYQPIEGTPAEEEVKTPDVPKESVEPVKPVEPVKTVKPVKPVEQGKPEDKLPEVKYSSMTEGDYFTKVEWIKRNGEISLSIYPKSPIKLSEVEKVDIKHVERSFELLKDRYGTDIEWDNTESLGVQYRCHVQFARDKKVPWNIEPHRTETDYTATVFAGCNP